MADSEQSRDYVWRRTSYWLSLVNLAGHYRKIFLTLFGASAVLVTLISIWTTFSWGSPGYGLIRYYSFDKNRSDSPGRGKSMSVVRGRYQDGLFFNSDSDVFEIDDLSLDNLNTVTIMGWVKPLDSNKVNQTIIEKKNDKLAGASSWSISVNGIEKSIEFYLHTNQEGLVTLSTDQNVLQQGRWNHIAATYNGDSLAIYVDGIQRAVKSASGFILDDEGSVATIGNRLPADLHSVFRGYIDEIAILDAAIDTSLLRKYLKQNIALSKFFSDDEKISQAVLNSVDRSKKSAPSSVGYDNKPGPLQLPEGNVAIFQWGDLVSLIGEDVNGKKAPIVSDKNGFGPATSRNRFQLDYDGNSQQAESIYIQFKEPASNISIGLSRMELNEWDGLPETGAWAAYNYYGAVVAFGSLEPENQSGIQQISENSVVRNFSFDLENIYTLRIFPTPYGGGAGQDQSDNNSDFSLYSVQFSSNSGEQMLSLDPGLTISAKQSESAGSTLPEDRKTGNSNNSAVRFDDSLPLGGVFYGNYEYGLYTGNSSIGYESARRFRAEKTGAIDAIRYNNRTLSDDNIENRCRHGSSDSIWCACLDAELDRFTCGYTLGNSYTVGNGGTLVIEIHEDRNGLPSGVPLGRTAGEFVPQQNSDSHYPVLPLEQPVALESGYLYHLVYRNLTPPSRCTLTRTPVEEAHLCPRNEGAMGLNGTLIAAHSPPQDAFDPFRGRSPANFFKATKKGDWLRDSNNLSWYEIRYIDGTWVGDSYAAYESHTSGQQKIEAETYGRQRFRVLDKDRLVTGVWLNFGHTSERPADGSSLMVKLKNNAGSLLATGEIKPSQTCRSLAVQGASTGVPTEKNCRDWGYTAFQRSVQLKLGTEYFVEFNARAGAGYLVSAYFPLDYGIWKSTSRNHWKEARAEVSYNEGRTWYPWSDKYQDRDLALLFTLEGSVKYLH